MMIIDTLRTKRATALLDVVCVGITIKKGQTVVVSVQYCPDWKHGGFRTVVGSGIGLGYTNHEAYTQAFSKGLK